MHTTSLSTFLSSTPLKCQLIYINFYLHNPKPEHAFHSRLPFRSCLGHFCGSSGGCRAECDSQSGGADYFRAGRRSCCFETRYLPDGVYRPKVRIPLIDPSFVFTLVRFVDTIMRVTAGEQLCIKCGNAEINAEKQLRGFNTKHLESILGGLCRFRGRGKWMFKQSSS
ncbi:hypothetical protein DE146DRAFT_321803 [Phaeosphaeria sp. MPI-PUGE-AT-0046c]|nr:hypothetical protein DE146DRAFT_321803 [Phaeosphaeria sp. MPI-PUGE-AT-0046c]